MGKVERNKIQKQNSLLNTAYSLFMSKGVSKTSIAEISEKAGIAKGTFYLYFKDKFDIRNKLISHESSKLFKRAIDALEGKKIETFDDKIIFIADYVINELNANQSLLTFISKNLSWGIFKDAMTNNVADNDINFLDIYYEMITMNDIEFEDPEIMLFMIVELISSTCYSAILYKEPTNIEELKPHLYRIIRSIIESHDLNKLSKHNK